MIIFLFFCRDLSNMNIEIIEDGAFDFSENENILTVYVVRVIWCHEYENANNGSRGPQKSEQKLLGKGAK